MITMKPPQQSETQKQKLKEVLHKMRLAKNSVCIDNEQQENEEFLRRLNSVKLPASFNDLL